MILEYRMDEGFSYFLFQLLTFKFYQIIFASIAEFSIMDLKPVKIHRKK